MASLDRRSNHLYAIKECSSCGNLHTKDCGCPKGSLEDKILVPIPDLSQRPLKIEKICLDCGDPVHGLYCRQCALIRKTLEEVFQDFQDTSKSSNDDTNFVNQEPFVTTSSVNDVLVSLVGKVLIMVIIVHRKFRLSLNRNHATIKPLMSSHRDLPSVQPTSCTGDENSFTYDSKPNFVDDSPNVFNPPPQPPMYSCEFCGNDARYGHYCTPQVPLLSTSSHKEEEKRIVEEQAAKDRYWKIPICYDDDNDYTIAITPVLPTKEPVNSLSMRDKHLDTILATESDEVIKSSVEDLVPIPSESEGIPDSVCDVPLCNNPTSLEAFKEHSETIIDSNDDSTSSDDDSYENIDYVDASPPDAEIVSLEVVEIVIPEVGGIDTDILLTIKDDILREKLLNVNLLIANIEALKDNPAPSSDVMTKSSSTSLNLFLEETNTFDNSSPESETFCFDLEENSSGSTTTRSDYSLPDYEAFYSNDNHTKEKSSGSTTTHADFSQYDSFIFDLSINPFPPADRSDVYHEEFAGELAHIISPSEYDHFCFKIEPELGNLTMDEVEDIFPTREPKVHVPNVLPTHPTLDTDFILLSEPLFAYIVWIFLPFLTYPVAPPYLLSCGNEDTIFDPGISIYHSFMPGISHRSGTFMKFNVHPKQLNESPMEILSSTCSPMDQ
ncbi:hypothetical protein Tco_1164307 [Tanacetum coccineum]